MFYTFLEILQMHILPVDASLLALQNLIGYHRRTTLKLGMRAKRNHDVYCATFCYILFRWRIRCVAGTKSNCNKW